MVLENAICNVKIFVDDTYTVDSTNNQTYDLVINPQNFDHNDIYKTFSVHIDLFYKVIKIALVGSCYSIDTDCAILDGEILTVLQDDTILQIKVTDGSLLRCKKIVCSGCNYGIYKIKKGYIIYGETEIIMLDFEFNKIWNFSGKNIFVSLTKKNSFELGENSIKLYDFDDNFYEIDFSGNLISEI